MAHAPSHGPHRRGKNWEFLFHMVNGGSAEWSKAGGGGEAGADVDPWMRLAQLESRVKVMENDIRQTVASNTQLRASVTRLQARNDQLRAQMYTAQARGMEQRMTAVVGGPLTADEETLQLGCAAAGVVCGLVAGRVVRQAYLGAVAGAVAAAFYAHRPDSKAGNFVRICGKVVIIAGYKVRALSQELLVRWRAWNVWERLFKEFEALDKRYAVTQKMGSINDKYQIAEYVSGLASVVTTRAVEAGTLIQVPVEKVSEGFGPHLDHLSKSIAHGLEGVGRDIESNYNGTVSAWTGLTRDVSNLTATWTDGIRTQLFSWEAAMQQTVGVTRPGAPTPPVVVMDPSTAVADAAAHAANAAEAAADAADVAAAAAMAADAAAAAAAHVQQHGAPPNQERVNGSTKADFNIVP